MLNLFSKATWHKNLSANPRGFLACRGLDRSLKPEDIGIKGVILGRKGLIHTMPNEGLGWDSGS